MIAPPDLTFVDAVREFIELDPGATSKYSDATIGSNIRAATWFIERATGRMFGLRTGRTMVFSTNGAPVVPLPGLRTATSVTFASSALISGQTYWLLPDVQQTGVYTGIQVRGFTQRTDGPWYLGYPDWFDRNLDHPHPGYGGNYFSLPNDLVVVGDWGYPDAEVPEPARMAVKVLASFLTKYPDAILVGSSQTALGGNIDLSGFPLPVQQFITEWRVGSGVAST